MWPQWTLLTLFALAVITAGYEHNKPRPPTNVGKTLVDAFVYLFLLYEGGFFKGL